MQVSWIEPDQLRDLVGQLQRPPEKANAVAWELHTLPNETGLGARELGIDDGDLWLPNDQPQAAAAEVAMVSEKREELFAPTVETVEEPTEEIQLEESPPPLGQSAELSRIREKLQAIRERAIEAGLLAHVRPAEEIPPAAEVPVNPVFEPVAELEPSLPEAPTQEDFAPPAPASEPLLPIKSPFALAEPDMPAVSDSASSDESSFQVPQGAISERLEAFAAWAERRLYLSDLLVVDDHGDILWGDHAQAGLVVSAMMACKATLRSSALGAVGLSGVIEQPISAGRTLIIVLCDTSYGTLNVAIVRDASLSEADVTLLRNALVEAVETRSAVSPSPQSGSALD